MKTIVEQMTTMIILSISVLIFTFIMIISLQILNARLIHDSGIEKIQASYYTITVDDLNKNLKDNWYFEINELSSINTRKDYEVALNYVINIPLINNDLKGRIVGYAR